MVYDELQRLALQSRAQEDTVSYLAQCLSHFVKRMDPVLICFPHQAPGDLGHLMEQAVLLCEGVPVVWGSDHRWMSLLRLAFSSRARTIISTPLIALGLSKLQSYYATPLFIRDVVTAGYPCEEWMIDGIGRGFDCTPRGCLSLDTTGVVAGFSCEKIHGIHVRTDAYQVTIADPAGNPLPEGEWGEIILSPKGRPELQYSTGENARLSLSTCVCGQKEPLLVDIGPGRTEEDSDLRALGDTLQSWNSVLDCRLKRGDYGLEIEMIILPGGQLPKLPSAAKQIVRPLNPETDEPFAYSPAEKILKSAETAIDF